MTATPPERLELRWRRCSRDLDHLQHARNLGRCRGIELGDLAAVDRRAGDDGVDHAVETRVDAVVRTAGGDVEVVDEADLALADIAKLGRVLELEARSDREQAASAAALARAP